MDYMTLKDAAEQWGVTPRQGKLLLCGWAYPRRCENGRCLADPQNCREAD